MSSGGVSLPAVMVTTGGALLAYAGLTGQTPLNVLRGFSTGKLKPIADKSSSGIETLTPSSSSATASGPHPEFVAALQQFAGDKYSETKRNQSGYSDCSSFVSKGMRAAGVSAAYIAGWPRTTITLKSWSAMSVVSTASMGAGDLAISNTNGTGAHVVMIVQNGMAIGQQNPTENVKAGPIADLITVPYKIYRYNGPSERAVAT